jgi:hypothetical protein
MRNKRYEEPKRQAFATIRNTWAARKQTQESQEDESIPFRKANGHSQGSLRKEGSRNVIGFRKAHFQIPSRHQKIVRCIYRADWFICRTPVDPKSRVNLPNQRVYLSLGKSEKVS